jgi:hypothetical protein
MNNMGEHKTVQHEGNMTENPYQCDAKIEELKRVFKAHSDWVMSQTQSIGPHEFNGLQGVVKRHSRKLVIATGILNWILVFFAFSLMTIGLLFIVLLCLGGKFTA